MNSIINIWQSSPSMTILCFFFGRPTGEFFGAEVAKSTGLSAGAVHKHLLGLMEDGMLDVHNKGRMKFFSLNKRNPVARHLKIAYTLSSSPMRVLANAVRKMEGTEAFLYGSAARGEDDEKSDLDVLILYSGEKRPSASEILAQASRLARPREIRLSLHTRKEWASGAKEDRAFYESVERDKIRIA